MYNFISSLENRLFLWGQGSSNNHSIHWQLIWEIMENCSYGPRWYKKIPKWNRLLKWRYNVYQMRELSLAKRTHLLPFMLPRSYLLQEAFPNYEGWSKNLLLTPKFQLLLLGSLVFWTEGGENMMRNVLGIYIHILCIEISLSIRIICMHVVLSVFYH